MASIESTGSLDTPSVELRNSPWVLLRGWGRESGHWGDFPTQLANSLQAKVLCLDLPGSGSRYDEVSPLTIQGQVNLVRHSLPLLRANLAPGQKFYLLAISLGSMVAANWAERFPDEIAGLVMINPSFRGVSPFYARLRIQAIPRILGALMESDPVQSEMKVLNQVSNRPDFYQKTSEAWARLRQTHPVSRLNFFRQLVAASMATLAIRQESKVRTLILASEADRLVNSPRCSRDAARALGASLIFHPTAGHDIPLDDPEWLIEQIRIFKAIF